MLFGIRQSDPNSELLQVVTKSWEKLDDYHINTGSAQAITTILDPCSKLATFQNLSWYEE